MANWLYCTTTTTTTTSTTATASDSCRIWCKHRLFATYIDCSASSGPFWLMMTRASAFDMLSSCHFGWQQPPLRSLSNTDKCCKGLQCQSQCRDSTAYEITIQPSPLPIHRFALRLATSSFEVSSRFRYRVPFVHNAFSQRSTTPKRRNRRKWAL